MNRKGMKMKNEKMEENKLPIKIISEG